MCAAGTCSVYASHKMLIKHWLVLLMCLGFAVVNGKPAFAGGAMFGRAPAGRFDGFGWNSPARVGVPTMRLAPAGPGMTIARQGLNPAPRTAPISSMTRKSPTMRTTRRRMRRLTRTKRTVPTAPVRTVVGRGRCGVLGARLRLGRRERGDRLVVSAGAQRQRDRGHRREAESSRHRSLHFAVIEVVPSAPDHTLARSDER